MRYSINAVGNIACGSDYTIFPLQYIQLLPALKSTLELYLSTITYTVIITYGYHIRPSY